MRVTKKLLLILLLVSLPCHFCIADPIVIGEIFGVSGAWSRFGEWYTRGAALGLEAINASGGVHGNSITFSLQDSEGMPVKAVSGFRNLVTLQSVQYLLTANSSVALAIAPLANRAGVVQMEVSATSLLYSTPNDYTFRTGVLVTPLIEKIVEYLNTLPKEQRVAVLSIENDKGEAGRTCFKNTFKGNIVLEETYKQTEPDFRPLLMKVVQSKADTIFISGLSSDTGLIVLQASQLGIKAKIFSDAYSVESPDFLKIAKQSANEIIYSVPSLGDSILAKNFHETYVKTFKEQPSFIAAQSFDAVYSLALAMRMCDQVSPSCVKEALSKVSFDGASGHIQFNEMGDVISKNVELKVIRNGEFQLLKEPLVAP